MKKKPALFRRYGVSLLLAMVGGFPVVWLVSLFTKKMSPEKVDKIFECYKK